MTETDMDTGMVLVDNSDTEHISHIEIGENVEIVSNSDILVNSDDEFVNSTLGEVNGKASYIVGDDGVLSLECVESFMDVMKESECSSVINGNDEFVTEEIVCTSPIEVSDIFSSDNLINEASTYVSGADVEDGYVGMKCDKSVVPKVGAKRTAGTKRIEGIIGGKQRKVTMGAKNVISSTAVSGVSVSVVPSISQQANSAKGQSFKNTIHFKSVLKSATGLQEFQPLPKKYMMKKKTEGKVPISATPVTVVQPGPQIIALPIGSSAIMANVVPAIEGNKMRFVRLVNGQVLVGPNVASLKPTDPSKTPGEVGLIEEKGGGKFHPILPAATTTAKTVKFCPILPAPSSQNGTMGSLSQPKTIIMKPILPAAGIAKASTTIGHAEVTQSDIISSSIQVTSQSASKGTSAVLSSGNSVKHDQIASQEIMKSKENGAEGSDTNEDESKSNGLKSRKPCNCTRSQCLKLYCECFANGEFCFECNCVCCFNNLSHEENRQVAIKSCLERNPHAFRPKIGKCYVGEKERIHKRGCNCKRSGCLKNYCECYEAKIPCSENCKCSGCKNLEDIFERDRTKLENPGVVHSRLTSEISDAYSKARDISGIRQAYSSMTGDVIDATCQCLFAQAEDSKQRLDVAQHTQKYVIEEFGRCLKQIVDCITNLFYTENDEVVIPVVNEEVVPQEGTQEQE